MSTKEDLIQPYVVLLKKLPIPILEIGELLKLFTIQYPSYYIFAKPSPLIGEMKQSYQLCMAAIDPMTITGTLMMTVATSNELYQMSDYVKGYVDGYKRRD